MIEKVTIRGFQCHDDLELSLDPHVTVLTGMSSAGKSAVLRAIKWVLTNRPLGKEFVGDWGNAKFAKVVVKIDGHTVTRKRGGEVNEYRTDGEVLKAFGNESPQSVSDIANVGDINFQDAHEAPFWFSLPPAQVSRELNGIINLGSIDRTLAVCAKEVRKAKLSVEVSRDRLRKARLEKKTSQWAVQFSQDVNRVTALFDRLAAIENKRARLDDLLQAGRRAVSDRDRASAVAKMAQSAVITMRKCQESAGKVASLEKLVIAGREAYHIVNVPLPDLTRLNRLREKIKEVDRKVHSLQSYMTGASFLTWEIRECRKQVRQTEIKLKRMAGKRCPSCGQNLPRS